MNLFSRGRVLLIAATLCAAGAATAATAPPKEELSQLRGRIEAMQKRLAAAEGVRSEAADGLRDSERAISESNRSLRDLAAKQRAIQARLIDLQQQETRAGNDIESQQRLLARQLYQQYIGNGGGRDFHQYTLWSSRRIRYCP